MVRPLAVLYWPCVPTGVVLLLIVLPLFLGFEIEFLVLRKTLDLLFVQVHGKMVLVCGRSMRR